MSTFVQSKSFGSTGSGTTLAVTLNNPSRTGNSILVYFYAQTAVPTGVADGTNTYTKDFEHTASNGKKQAWRSDNITASATPLTITATFTSNTLPREMIVVEHRNLTSSSFDASDSTSVGGNTTTSPLFSGSITPAQNLELLVGVYAVFNGTPTGTPIGGFSHAINENTGSTSYTLGYADQVINSTNGQKTAFTWSAGGTAVGVFAFTYKINSNTDPLRINALRPAIFKPGLAR